MLQTKRLIPLVLLCGALLGAGGIGGCGDEPGGSVSASKCPQGCPLGQICDEVGALGCHLPGQVNNSENNANANTNNANGGDCAAGCAPPADACEGNTAVTHSGDGTCANAACDYSAVRQEEACEFACDAGGCTDGGAGAFCTRDAQCGEGFFCNTGTTVCAAGCRVGGCEAGSTCDVATRACVSGCAPDAQEPNEDEASAAALTFTPGQVLTIEGLTVCEGDVDLFSLTLSDDHDVALLLEAASGGGNLSAALIDPAGIEVAADADARDIELSASSTAAGAWLLRVEHGADTAAVEYALTLRVTSRSSTDCAPDLQEPNNTAATAAALALEYEESLSVNNLTLCEGDVDQFRFEAAANDRLDLSFSPLPAEGLQVRIVNEDSGEDVFNGAVADTNTSSWTLAAGSHVIVVTPTQAVTPEGIDWGMRLLLSAQSMACPDDPLEMNDVCDDARNVAAPGATGLSLCAGDPGDWYTIFVPAGSMADLGAVYEDVGQGTLSMIVYTGGCGGEPTLGERGMCDGAPCERLAAPLAPLEDTTYAVQIQSANVADRIGYDLDVTLSGCAPDLYEPNGSFDLASGLATTCRTRAHVCPADADVYRVNVAADETFTLSVRHFRIQDGGVDLELFNSAMTRIATSLGTSDCEQVTNAGALGDTTYYVRVRGEDGGSNDEYRIVWGVPCNQPEPANVPICQ